MNEHITVETEPNRYSVEVEICLYDSDESIDFVNKNCRLGIWNRIKYEMWEIIFVAFLLHIEPKSYGGRIQIGMQ